MSEIFLSRVLAVVWAMAALTPAVAGNWTLLADFDGSEASMQLNEASQGCPNPPDVLPYKELGTIQVSVTGRYFGADLSPRSEALPALGSKETVLLIYDGAFDPQDLTMNRVGLIDYASRYVEGEDWVDLTSGTEYRIVVQAGCDAEPGLGGFVLRGPGAFSGAGSPTPEKFYGDFSEIMNIADFPDWGTHKYESFTYTTPKTGYYWFLDVGQGWTGSFVNQRLYAGSFDPENPMENLLATGQYWGFRVFLEAGQPIEVVNVDRYDSEDIYQMVMYPPGELQGFNPAITGAFADLSIKNQGIMIETDEVFDLVFFTWFTFDDDPNAQPVDTAVGSTDQRWLSAFGPFFYDNTEVVLSFENSTGGRFNHPEPVPTQNSAYGSGSVVARDCYTLEVSYNLPGTAPGSMILKRLFPGKGRICADWVWVGSPID